MELPRYMDSSKHLVQVLLWPVESQLHGNAVAKRLTEMKRKEERKEMEVKRNANATTDTLRRMGMERIRRSNRQQRKQRDNQKKRMVWFNQRNATI